MSIIIRILVNALALAAAAYLIDGIQIAPGDPVGEQILTYTVIAALFGVVNAVIKPIVKTVGCAFYVLTLGLIALVVNALLLMLTAWAAGVFGFDFVIADFWPSAVLGALVITIVSWLLSWLLPDNDDD
ncbi:phage holin family protein [Nocardiopsis coralliicola]